MKQLLVFIITLILLSLAVQAGEVKINLVVTFSDLTLADAAKLEKELNQKYQNISIEIGKQSSGMTFGKPYYEGNITLSPGYSNIPGSTLELKGE